ncbi:MAG: glutamine synthetase III [Bacteroidales bacterium]|nr:glutamine synthetase III [Bacteroidales bacterium]MBN2819179.1 glutamine synthetase III [Bacteroidales bacterium]
MAQIRFFALQEAQNRQPVNIEYPNKRTSEYFGSYVFDKRNMQEYLSQEAFAGVMESIEKGDKIDRKLADQVAVGMKAWALDLGATYYTHWFSPLTDGTAEKHDAFIQFTDTGGVIEAFSGKLLAQQEPDASSFPSGGIRNTFEARGYTAWDPTSPAFILDRTLCIPTIFVSYTGEALDHKTPLLKALNAVDKAATAICEYFDKNVTKVSAALGWEQEYFLVDEALFNARPDLVACDRTLVGHQSAKNQQLDDQYFSSIPERISSFMRELEIEGYKLGIPIKTRHNEVAPNQYEVTPIYEECNLAVDHNLLIMDIMKKIARHHKFRIIFHEKPFQEVNGSGKHNNWSLITNTGVNLLSPGAKPKTNMQFLSFLVCTLNAVYKHQDLLRASIVSAGNALRLGANEAPPLIISAFVGNQITEMLDDLETRVTDKKMTPDEKTELKLDVGKIPEILLDNTDRNRTSPFAFTGNRFEFRAVGASANPAAPMIVLNTAVAQELKDFKREVDKLIEKGVKKDEAIFQVIREFIIKSKKIRFEGNSYSEEWHKEAKKRGLSNITNVIEAIDAYTSKTSVKLFVANKVFSEKELEARTEVRYDNFTKKIQIESRVLAHIAINQIVPTAIEYQTRLINNVKGLKELFGDDAKEMTEGRIALIKELSEHTSSIKAKVKEMNNTRKIANTKNISRDKAYEYSLKVVPFLAEIRYHIDKLERVIDNEMWPLPKYSELLFTR